MLISPTRLGREQRVLRQTFPLLRSRLEPLKELEVDALQFIYWGTRNLYFPAEMSMRLNIGEKVSKYFTAGRIKKLDNPDSPYLLLSYRARFENDFHGLVTSLDQSTYPSIARVINSIEKEFSINPGDQAERLRSLEDGVKRAFLRSFFAPAVVPSYDPGIDGRSKRIYINLIHDGMTNPRKNFI